MLCYRYELKKKDTNKVKTTRISTCRGSLQDRKLTVSGNGNRKINGKRKWQILVKQAYYCVFLRCNNLKETTQPLVHTNARTPPSPLTWSISECIAESQTHLVVKPAQVDFIP